jgi:CRISPR-associated endonuclease Csn1
MGLRYAFDIGTNSIGYAVWQTGQDLANVFGQDAPIKLLMSGSRIFKDGRNPKDGESLAVMRRVPKQARVRRDRFIKRRDALMDALIEQGMMPSDATERKALAGLDPYMLRAKGVDSILTLHEFGRALFHMNQRRGFQSNRKADRKGKGDKSNESGKIASASLKLEAELQAAGAKTYGQWLWNRHKAPNGTDERQPVRIRMEGQGAKALYDFYPTRAMLKHEFDVLWAKQSENYPDDLTDKLRDHLRDYVMFHQRPLKPAKVGFCTLAAGELRIPKALPSVEARAIYQTLNDVRAIAANGAERTFTPQERNLVAGLLLYGHGKSNSHKLKWNDMRKQKGLNLKDARFNFEESGSEHLEGSKTSCHLAKDTHLGTRWRMMDWAAKDAFMQRLLDAGDDDVLTAELMADFGLTEAQAKECANVPLTDGYGRLGHTANAAILEALIHEVDGDGCVIPYSEAVKRAGEKLGQNWHHSHFEDGELKYQLPYYATVLERHVMPGTRDEADKDDPAKFYGRIMNPTVHIGLNQLRQTINEIMRTVKANGWSKDGNPDQIILELARELKQSQDEKDRITRENRSNKDANDRRAILLAELGQENTGENRAKLKLYEEQKLAGGGFAKCPFSLKSIPLEALFTADIEIEHILPYSRTFDDGAANKVVCFRERNRVKRGRSPSEAFGNSNTWLDILANAQTLPKNKRWRFQPDAMENFEQAGLKNLTKKEQEEMGLTSGFLARQLNETKYLSRLAKAYVSKICDPRHIYVTTGQLTSMLRGRWGLNSILADDNRKNRDDHRHHAIDAIVIGAMTRGFLNQISRAAGQGEQGDLDRILDKFPWPFPEFRDQVRDIVRGMTVSFKPEHGISGALHDDTAYGVIKNPAEAKAIGNLVRRKALVDLTIGEIDSIRDATLRTAVQAAVAHLRDDNGKLLKGKDKELAPALRAFWESQIGDNQMAQRIRRVRYGKANETVKLIANRQTGLPYKAVIPGENHHMDIVQMRDGTWKGFAVSLFDASRKDFRPEWERDKLGGKLVMRLHKGDLVEVDDKDGQRRVKQVIRINPSANRLYLVSNNEAGDYQTRHELDDTIDPFRWDLAGISGLKERNCIAVNVSPAGQVKPRKSNT